MLHRMKATGVLLLSSAAHTVLYVVTPLDIHPGLAAAHALANQVDASASWSVTTGVPELEVLITGPLTEVVEIIFDDPAYITALKDARTAGAPCLAVLCASKAEVEQSVVALRANDRAKFMEVGIGCTECEFPVI